MKVERKGRENEAMRMSIKAFGHREREGKKLGLLVFFLHC